MKTVITLFLLAIFQITLADSISIGGIRPDLLLIATAFFAIYRGPSQGLKMGLLAGLLKDGFSASVLGINMFNFGVCGLMVGCLAPRFYKESFLAQSLICLFSSTLACLLYLLVSSIFLGHLLTFSSAAFVTISSAIYTAIFGPPLFWLLNFHRKELRRVGAKSCAA